MEISGDVSHIVKENVRRRFVLGPSVEREFWEEGREQLDLDRGPCKCPEDILCFAFSLTHRKGLLRAHTWKR